jgi:eukaryotic-like serine/threonine-protein kinase
MRAPASRQVASFGPFELDLKAGELHRDDHAILLQEQPFLVLKMLLERAGDVVTREEMRRTLWPNDTIVEFDQSINAAIKKLRIALDDSADNPQYVETVARRGYRLIVPVDWLEPMHGDAQEKGAELPVEPLQDTGSLIGKRVSHYRVLEVLGGGGMGVVYKAEDIKLGRSVALKFLPEELAGDAAAMQRFEREARAASALNHPNICTIYAVEEYEGQPFLAMELLEGHTLRDLIAQQADSKTTFQLKPLLDTAVQIVNGLEAAHQKGIIHRDIKPANIFITNNGQAKILDFGLAKLHEFESLDTQPQATAEPKPKQEWNPLLTLTRTGVTVGTAAYMSPEQVRGEKLDPRTDLFSFGLVLYEMATRQRAFPGDTAAVLHHGILNQTPAPVRELNPQIPANLGSIISRAIEKDRTMRYQTAAEICADLAALQRRLAPKHMSRARFWGLGVAAAILMASFFLLLMKKPKTVSVAPEIKMRQLTTNSSENPVAGGAISPDGKYLAYIDTRGLHLKFIDTGETRTIPKSEVVKDQTMQWEVGPWFPDGTRLLINVRPSAAEQWNDSNISIWAVSVPGAVATKFRDHAFAWSISPDGSLVSFGRGKGKLGPREFWLMRADGENARKIRETGESSAIAGFGWSPDGKRYTYVLTDSSGDTVFSSDTTGGPPVALFRPSEMAATTDFVWLHDGRMVYSLHEPTNYDTCNYWTMRLDLATGKHIEEPRRVTNWPNFCVFGGSVTNNDKRLAFVASSGFYTSYVADLEAGGKRIRNVKRFTSEVDDAVHGWTADGKVLVAQNRDTWSLYKQSLDSDTPEPIVSSVAGGALQEGATTPDGKWYIGPIWPDGESPEHPTIPFPILRIPLASGTPETILQLSRKGNVSCARPPSNRCVLAEQSQDRKQMIVSTLDPIKGRGSELVRFDFDQELGVLEFPICFISPDGARLAMARSPESPLEIRSLHGQLIRKVPSRSVGKLIWLNWSADQKGLFATREGQSGNELLYLDLQGKATFLRKCGDSGGNLSGGQCEALPSPDGRHLAILDRDQSNNMWMMENF